MRLLFAILLSIPALAANRYWVGGGSSANWNATGPTNWGTASNTQDDASVPGADDDVFFDGVGTGASNSTLSASITINSLDMTGYANTLTHNASVTLTVDGNGVVFKLAAGMTYTRGSATTSALSFIGTSGTTLITTAGKTLGSVTFNGSGGGWRLEDGFTTTSTSVLTLTQGTLNTNSQTLSIGQFSSNNPFVRTLTMGSSQITVAGSVTGAWNVGTGTFTVSANTATVIVLVTSAISDTSFAGGGLNYNGMSLTFSGGATTHQGIITGSNTFATLTGTNMHLTGGLELTAGTTTTVSNFVMSGVSGDLALLISSSAGSAATLSKASGTVSCDYLSIKDSTAAGGAAWYAGANSTDVSGNTGWVFTAPPSGVTRRRAIY